MKTIIATPVLATLISKWEEAKDAEEAWAEVRKQAAEEILKLIPGPIAEARAELEAGTAMTKTVNLADRLDLSVGVELKVSDQAAARDFLKAHPDMVEVLLETEIKPVTKAVLSQLRRKGAYAEELTRVMKVSDKTPGLARRKPN